MSIKFQRELKFSNAKLQNFIDKLLEDETPTFIEFKSLRDKDFNRFTDLKIYIMTDSRGNIVNSIDRYKLFSEGETIELMRNSSEFVVVDIVPEKVLAKQNDKEVPIDAYAIKIIERTEQKSKFIPSVLGGPGSGDIMYNIISPFRNLSKAIEDSRPDWSFKPDPRFPPIRDIGQLQINKNKEGENNND